MFNPDVDEYSLEDVINSMAIFDEDNDGRLTIQQLEKAMTQFGEEIDETEGGGNTKMSLEEFTQMKIRLTNADMIDEFGMIEIQELARMFMDVNE